jgi:hypothetical protein
VRRAEVVFGHRFAHGLPADLAFVIRQMLDHEIAIAADDTAEYYVRV